MWYLLRKSSKCEYEIRGNDTNQSILIQRAELINMHNRFADQKSRDIMITFLVVHESELELFGLEKP